MPNDGLAVLRAAPGRYAIEPKVDGVHTLVMFGPDGIKVRSRFAQVGRVTRTGRDVAEAVPVVVEAIETDHS